MFFQYFHRIHPSIYLPIFCCLYIFHNLNTCQNHMTYRIHIRNYQDSKHILYHIHLYQLILYICISIYHDSHVVYYCKQLYLIYMCTYTFHAILCLVSLVLDIRLNTLTFKSFTTSGTHIFAYESLILLQLPLHLLVLILKG